jgi:aminoglycoside phosphotransferase (APT) family kinase protein
VDWREVTGGDLRGVAAHLLGAYVEPLPGGWSGETFRVVAGGEQLELRLYSRHPERAEVDVALLRLVRGLVPVPEVVEVRLPRSEFPVAIVLTSLLPGERLDLVLADLGPDDPLRAQLGRSVGAVLARLSGMPFLSPGPLTTTDARAASSLVVEPMAPDALDLESWVERHLPGEPFRHWPDDLRTGLSRLARAGAELLDAVTRTCLVHSDFNPKNLLVDRDTGAVTGLVDWEYAHAGGPATDLGNLLRSEPEGLFARTATETLRSLAVGLPDDLVATAGAADIFALVDLAARPVSDPVVRDARRLLASRARQALRARP